jgi:hypothetical protein
VRERGATCTQGRFQLTGTATKAGTGTVVRRDGLLEDILLESSLRGTRSFLFRSLSAIIRRLDSIHSGQWPSFGSLPRSCDKERGQRAMQRAYHTAGLVYVVSWLITSHKDWLRPFTFFSFSFIPRSWAVRALVQANPSSTGFLCTNQPEICRREEVNVPWSS